MSAEVKRIIAVGGGHVCPDCAEKLANKEPLADVCAANGWFEHFDPLKEIVCVAGYQVELENLDCGKFRRLIIWRVVDGKRGEAIWIQDVHESQIAKEPYLVWAP